MIWWLGSRARASDAYLLAVAHEKNIGKSLSFCRFEFGVIQCFELVLVYFSDVSFRSALNCSFHGISHIFKHISTEHLISLAD